MTRLFYDGACGLCNGAVQFVARHDRSGRVRFSPLGGATFERLIDPASRAGLPDSLVVLTVEGDLLLRSRAVIHLLRRMGPAWRWLGHVLAWVPGWLRDAAYDQVARLRPAKRACEVAVPSRDERFEP